MISRVFWRVCACSAALTGWASEELRAVLRGEATDSAGESSVLWKEPSGLTLCRLEVLEREKRSVFDASDVCW